MTSTLSSFQSPISTGPFSPTSPGGQSGIPKTPALQQQQAQQALQQQLTSQFGVGDIFSGAGDVWGWLTSHAGNLLPKNADGSVDWGKLVSEGGDAIKNIGSFLLDHKADILAGANVVNAAYRQTQADNYAKGALKTSQDNFAEKAPLRVAGIQGMLNPKTPDRSNLQTLATTGSGNPFTKGALPVAGAWSGSPNAPGGGAGQIPMASWPGAPGGPPFVPTPGVNGDPNAGQSGTIGAPRQPLPVSFAPQSGPISAGPQNRPTPTFRPLPIAPPPNGAQPINTPIAAPGANPATSPNGYTGLPFVKLPTSFIPQG